MKDFRVQIYRELRTRGLSTAQAVRQLAAAGMADFSIAQIAGLSIERVQRLLAEKVS